MARSAASSRRRRPRAGVRHRYSSGTRWEPTVGYSRAIRVGAHVYVSGTTAFDANGSIVGARDPYRQTVQVLDNIERGLRALGSGREEIVRLRIFVTDRHRVGDVTRALGERFRPIRPAMTLVVVPALLEPAMMVEIEAEADDLPNDPGPPPARRRARVRSIALKKR